VKPGSTVAVVGDGAVGLLGVLSAKQMGAKRIIAMSRHGQRQKLAREFGATEIVTERGDEGINKIKELTDGVGADSVLECVGTQESMMQAINSTHKGGYVSYVGVPHGVELNGEMLFYSHVLLHGGPAPVRRYPADRTGVEPEDQPRQSLRPDPAPRSDCGGISCDGRAPCNQGVALSEGCLTALRQVSKEITTMEIKRVGSQASGKGPVDYFTGTVRIDPLFEAHAPARALGSSVAFEPGARTAWHTHPLGQILVVTAGCGWVQREGGPIEEIRPGDVVWFSPGEKHWHGATPTTGMTHIAILEQLDGKSGDWMEKVTDEQYRR